MYGGIDWVAPVLCENWRRVHVAYDMNAYFAFCDWQPPWTTVKHKPPTGVWLRLSLAHLYPPLVPRLFFFLHFLCVLCLLCWTFGGRCEQLHLLFGILMTAGTLLL